MFLKNHETLSLEKGDVAEGYVYGLSVLFFLQDLRLW